MNGLAISQSLIWLCLLPPALSRFLRNLSPTLRRHRLRPCFAPLLAERLRSLVLAVVNDGFGFLACRDLGNADGVADHVSRALLAFRTGRQCLAPNELTL